MRYIDFLSLLIFRFTINKMKAKVEKGKNRMRKSKYMHVWKFN